MILTVSDLTSRIVVLGRCTLLLASSSFSFIGLVPFFSNLFFPVRLGSELVHTILNDGERLTNLVVLHIFLIVKFVCELKQVINFSFFIFFHLLSSFRPCRLCWCLLFLACY